MSTQRSTATATPAFPSRRDVLVNGAAMAFAAGMSALLSGPVAARGRTMASASSNPDTASDKGVHPMIKPGVDPSFGSLKQIDAGLLNVGYAEAGPANGPAVLL